jgi:hypothetical protein
VAAVVGRTVTIAAAGDSLAVLDAGAAVARVSAEHRLEGHGAERDRVIAAGATGAPLPHATMLRSADLNSDANMWQSDCSCAFDG